MGGEDRIWNRLADEGRRFFADLLIIGATSEAPIVRQRRIGRLCGDGHAIASTHRQAYGDAARFLFNFDVAPTARVVSEQQIPWAVDLIFLRHNTPLALVKIFTSTGSELQRNDVTPSATVFRKPGHDIHRLAGVKLIRLKTQTVDPAQLTRGGSSEMVGDRTDLCRVEAGEGQTWGFNYFLSDRCCCSSRCPWTA